MPTIKVEWIEGRTVEQKRMFAEKLTPMIAEIAGTTPERVKIEFHDIPKENIAWGGVLRSDEEASRK